MYCVYSRGHSKSVARSNNLIIGSDDKRDPKYVPLGIHFPNPAARSTRTMPTMVAPGVVTTSQSEEECILSRISSGSTAQFEKVSDSEDAFGSKEAFSFEDVLGNEVASSPSTPSQSALFNEADSADSTLAPRLASPTRFLISPTGGVLRGNIRYTPTPSYRMTWGS